jgi:hypothetical protein
MSFHVFDLLYTDPEQLRVFLLAMAKEPSGRELAP